MSKLIEHFWAAEPEWLRQYVKLIDSATPEQMELSIGRFKAQTVSDILTIVDQEAIIRIEGFLSPTGPDPIDQFFGVEGTSFAAIREAVETIESDDNIKRVTLSMDTPGGTVTGTDETFQALARLAKEKELSAVNFGLIASGGYWLAVAADKIIAASPTVETGSIGVVLVAFDFTEALKNFGVDKVVITSKNAPNKFADIATKEGVEILQKRLDSLERVLIARVAENRGVTEAKVINDFGKGGVIIAQDTGKGKPDAVSVGMIDEVVSPTGQKVENLKDISTKETPKNHGGNAIMTLQEFLNENLAAKAEFDAAISKAGSDAAEAADEKIKARAAKAKPILESTEYPNAIKDLAIKVVTGETEPSALDAAVASFDASKEAAAQVKANADAEDKETPPTAIDPGSDDGEIKTEADMAGAAARLKSSPETGEGDK